MNPANLPFDSETMLQGLRAWVECEKPRLKANADKLVNTLANRFIRDYLPAVFFLT